MHKTIYIGGQAVQFGPCQNSARAGFSYVLLPSGWAYVVNKDLATENEIRRLGISDDAWLAVVSYHGRHWGTWNV